MTKQDKIRIKRSQHGQENPYFMESRKTAQDESISYAALGLLSYLLSKPDNWEIVINNLKRTKCGRDKARSLLNELIEAKYVIKTPQTKDDDGHFTPAYYDVYESPCTENPSTENPSTVFAALHNTEERVQKKEKDSAVTGEAQKSDSQPIIIECPHCQKDMDYFPERNQWECNCLGEPTPPTPNTQTEYFEPIGKQQTEGEAIPLDVATRNEPDTPVSPTIDAGERVIFNSLSAKQRALLAQLIIDKYNTITMSDGRAAVSGLLNAGCIQPLQLPENDNPNAKYVFEPTKSFCLSVLGERLTALITTKELDRAINKLAKKNAAKGKKKEFHIAVDYIPYAAALMPTFHSTLDINTLMPSEQTMLVKVCQELKTRYTPGDVQKICDNWEAEKARQQANKTATGQDHWILSATIGTLINGKGHPEKFLHADDSQPARQEITIDVGNNALE